MKIATDDPNQQHTYIHILTQIINTQMDEEKGFTFLKVNRFEVE